MNKREAVAYAQITLDYMQSSKYTGILTPDTFGVEMRQAFKLYPRNIVLDIAKAQKIARNKIQAMKVEGQDNSIIE